MSGMAYDVEITGDQAVAIGQWAEAGGLHLAPVQLRVDETGYVYAAQGDERAIFGEAGDRVDEEEDEPRVPAHVAAAADLYGDPLAVLADGEPAFSDETRAAAQDDPRGERDR